MPYTFAATGLDKTVYLEVLEPSDYQGINIQVSFNGKTDNAKATAIWATYTRSWRDNTALPVPGGPDLNTLEHNFLLTRLNTTWISMTTDYRYGHGDYNRGKLGGDVGAYNKKFGGRILFEFAVSPKEAAKLVSFDITRQRA